MGSLDNNYKSTVCSIVGVSSLKESDYMRYFAYLEHTKNTLFKWLGYHVYDQVRVSGTNNPNHMNLCNMISRVISLITSLNKELESSRFYKKPSLKKQIGESYEKIYELYRKLGEHFLKSMFPRAL